MGIWSGIGDNLFEAIRLEELRNAFISEIDGAIEAEQNRRKAPPLTTVANIIRNGIPDDFGTEAMEKLADYLEGKHRGKRGNYAEHNPDADDDNVKAFIQYRKQGMNRDTALEKIAGRGYEVRSIEESIRRSLSRNTLMKQNWKDIIRTIT